MSIASYSFLPYLRQGIANNLQASQGARGVITVKLNVHGDNQTTPADEKTIQIYGPGDVIGIDARAVVKTDPRDWITNFEDNYLAYIDFYDEDFPWRYTPVPPDGSHLSPWIALVVLEEGEFDEGKNIANRPLPFVTLKLPETKSFFPMKDQLWAWAHVNFNGDLTAADNTIIVTDPGEVGASLDKLQDVLNNNPDFAYSRLLCPRKLKPTTSYHAFVIPAYESGRLAGVGADPKAIDNAGLAIAWDGPDLEFPYYYRWKFDTGTLGDFEYLVRLLKPKVVDSRVGRRVMDMTKPGSNLIWIENPVNSIGGILRLGGALKVPEESLTGEEKNKMRKFDNWANQTPPQPQFHPFQKELAAFLNLPDEYNLNSSKEANTAANESGLAVDPNKDSDPLIAPPIYGRWHAMVERVYQDRDKKPIDNNYNWINELNLDPRFRVPGHFGTRVVQENQEDFMNAAWEQIGDVLNANRQIRFGQFGLAASAALYAKHFLQANAIDASKTMLFTAPLQKRVMYQGSTVFHTVRQSIIPNAALSAPMRRIARPRGRLVEHLQKQLPPGEPLRLESAVTKINKGEVLPAPPKIAPPGVPTVDELVAQLEPGIPQFLKDWLRRFPWLPYVAFALATLLFVLLLFPHIGTMVNIGMSIVALLILFGPFLIKWKKQLKIADALKAENQTPQSVDTMLKSSNFHLVALDEKFMPTIGGTTDNTNAVLFKNSLKEMYRLQELNRDDAPRVAPPPAINLISVSEVILDQLKPEKTVPAFVGQYVSLPQWLLDQLADEGLVEAMAYPKINTAMYEALTKISDELFLPNINLIENNSITLLETNQPFIESYMVGLNHEFGRELLWREYPTDQRGSYFRQFWDVSTILKDPALAGKPEEQQREPYYDIPKLHEWRRLSKLGDHNHRLKPGELPKPEAVLVIRGELLKKYPTAVVYAHKAVWTNNKAGQPDVHEPRSLYEPEQGDKDKPDPAAIRTPLFSAKVDPDIYFFGFDLTIAEARGETEPENPILDNAGWFFVIKERPGEPRFGFDIPAADGGNNDLVTWNDLDWSKVVPAEEGVIDLGHLPAPLKLPATPPASGDDEQKGRLTQYNDDIKVTWGDNVDAADLAYILYQVPMMVCVHASQMLLKK